jgi:hypothetical protein
MNERFGALAILVVAVEADPLQPPLEHELPHIELPSTARVTAELRHGPLTKGEVR